MNRQQLEHIIRAAAANADTRELVVIDSQAILGAYPDAPEELLESMEADVFPKDDPASAILIDGAMGERSIFHDTFGYYAHGVGDDTAILPKDWQQRLVRVENENTRGAIGWCLDPHDIAVSKLIAGRDKDLDFVSNMLRHRLADRETIWARLIQTDLAEDRRTLCLARLKRLA